LNKIPDDKNNGQPEYKRGDPGDVIVQAGNKPFEESSQYKDRHQPDHDLHSILRSLFQGIDPLDGPGK